tara:strand:- start:2446 stop:2625 length:180 start_codon:yes stop_codon:yes gene_type:complete
MSFFMLKIMKGKIMIMNNAEDFAHTINDLWSKWDEGEITREQFNKQIKISIDKFLKLED